MKKAHLDISCVWIAAALVAAAWLLVGCQMSQVDTDVLRRGEYGQARVQLHSTLSDNPEDRAYLLDRMRVAILTLADGYPHSAQTIFQEVYETLRTQGINADKTVASVVIHEGVKTWKGEPFEQALALAFYSMQQAELGSWDNARAAAGNALFHLRDFGRDDQGERLDTAAIAARSLVYERAAQAPENPDAAVAAHDYLDHGYVVSPSNFTLGYLLNGIANAQLGRADEASDNFRRAVMIDDGLRPLVDVLESSNYNCVLVVGYGLGPAKEGYGPDNALGRFTPRHPSTAAALRVQVNDQDAKSYPQVLDVNHMAGYHMWNNLEDVRIAKSTVGNVLLTGGAIATTVGLHNDSPEAAIAGAAAILTGLLLKANAHVDTTYCDVMPQRLYLVPLHLKSPADHITLQVEGQPGSQLVLTSLSPQGHGRGRGRAILRYVALADPPTGQPPTWATSGQVFYGNIHTAESPAASLPYLLGGYDVRPPSARVLADYQAAGNLPNSTVADLLEQYRRQGIALTREDQRGYAGLHLLEAGRSLVAPLPGTAGFARLFGQTHQPYRSR